MREINKVKERIKNKQNIKEENNNTKVVFFLFKLTVIFILILFLSILCSKNSKAKNTIYKNVYNSSISFMSFKTMYNKYIGNVLPFTDIMTTKKVFSEKLEYKSLSKYNKGVKLKVSDNYLVPAIKGGIVIFTGEKDGKNTIIIQQSDGIDVYYSNFSNMNVKLYDYIEDNQILGEVKDNTLYLTFLKDGVEVDYKKVIE